MSQTTALPSEWFAFHSLTVGCQHIFAVNSMLQISQSCKGKSEQVLYNTVFTCFHVLDVGQQWQGWECTAGTKTVKVCFVM